MEQGGGGGPSASRFRAPVLPGEPPLQRPRVVVVDARDALPLHPLPVPSRGSGSGGHCTLGLMATVTLNYIINFHEIQHSEFILNESTLARGGGRPSLLSVLTCCDAAGLG